MWRLCAEHIFNEFVSSLGLPNLQPDCLPWVTGEMVYRLVNGVGRIRGRLACAELCRPRPGKRPRAGQGQGAQGKDGQKRTHRYTWYEHPSKHAKGHSYSSGQGNAGVSFLQSSPRAQLGFINFTRSALHRTQKSNQTRSPRMTPCVLHARLARRAEPRWRAWLELVLLIIGCMMMG
jgi:hypothetical protein